MFGKIGRVKFRSGCMRNNSVRRTGFLLVFIIRNPCDKNELRVWNIKLVVVLTAAEIRHYFR